MKSSLTRGFTLIELMVAVAVVAILAAIAYPSYTSYIRRGQLSEAYGSLADYRVKMEQYYQDNKSYGTTTCADTNAPTWAVWPVANLKYFSLTCALTNGGQGFTLTANGSSPQTTGYTYTVNESNQRKTTKFAGAAATAQCWASKSATTCDN